MSDQIRAQNLLRLKIDLAVRNDNNHVGSKLGGNPSQLFWLLTHNVIIRSGSKFHFDMGKDHPPQVVLYCPNEKVPFLEMRRALNEYYENQADKKEVTIEQLTNLSFLKDIQNPTTEIKLLMRSLEITGSVKTWLIMKRKVNSILSASFARETDALKKELQEELGLPENYFFRKEHRDYDRAMKDALEDDSIKTIHSSLDEDRASMHDKDHRILNTMLAEHPIYAPKFNAIKKRQEQMEQALLSQEELNKLVLLGAMPEHIFTLAVRSSIGIDVIVALDLDEKIGSAFSRVAALTGDE